MKATARARTNIALVKYWGKRCARLRLPQNGSISLTLDGLGAETTVAFEGDRDRLLLNGDEKGGRELARVTAFLDEVRRQAGLTQPAVVTSHSSVPVAAGLASSASGFAALAVAAAAAAGLTCSPRELSILARLGSGSACRSIFGGLVEWRAGVADDGRDSYAEQLLTEDAWPLGMAIAVVERREKETGSTEGMARSLEAPGYRHWLATVRSDLATARRAIEARDLATLGLIAESSATKMHLAAATTDPPIVYWNDVTCDLVTRIGQWRAADGLQAWFTVDAGPNVCALCREGDLQAVATRLAEVPGVDSVIACRAGRGAEVDLPTHT